MPAARTADRRTAAIIKDATERPTLAAIRRWPPTVGVPEAALALGIASATAYEWCRSGQFPCRLIMVGNKRRRILVVTADLVRVLEGKAA